MMRRSRPNPYQETADRIRALIDEFIAALPKPEAEPKLTEAERRAAAKVSISFIESIVSMAEASQDPRVLESVDIVKARDTLELLKDVRRIPEFLKTFATSQDEALRLKRAILTAQVRESYEAALKIPPDERSPAVIEFVEELKPFFVKRVRWRKRD